MSHTSALRSTFEQLCSEERRPSGINKRPDEKAKVPAKYHDLDCEEKVVPGGTRDDEVRRQ